MTTTPLRIHIDDRGASRQLVDLWLPYLDVDVVWLVGAPPPEDVSSAPLGVPLVELAPSDVVAVASEKRESELRALAIFASPQALEQAALLGLAPGKVTINRLATPTESYRVAHEVTLDDETLEQLRALEARGFAFEIQSLPNVTPRPWAPSRFVPDGDVEPNAPAS